MILHQEINSYLLGPCEQFLDTAETFVRLFFFFFFYALLDQVITFCRPLCRHCESQHILLFFQMLFSN